MPRSGPPTYTYSLPPIYLAIPGTTITAAQHNEPLEDIASTFNSIQPVVWGGTGAGTEAGARASLGLTIGSDVQAYSANLTALATAFARATASGSASLALNEDTDNGTNKVSLTVPAALSADRTYTFQDLDGSVYPTPAAPIFGCGQLQYTSTTVVTFKPFRGNLVSFPSGEIAVVGSSGITSTVTSAYLNGTAAQSLSASTLYYAYLWNQGTQTSPNWVIDWSTTSHATDTATGIEIKSGDATRVLIGMARPVAGPLFSYSATSRLVATWFNRRPVQMRNAFTTNRTTTATGYTEINSEIRCNFLSWGDEATFAYAGGGDNSAGQAIFCAVALDGAGTYPAVRCIAPNTNNSNLGVSGAFLPTEGFHYVTVLGAVSSATGTWDTTSSQGALSGTLVI